MNGLYGYTASDLSTLGLVKVPPLLDGFVKVSNSVHNMQ